MKIYIDVSNEDTTYEIAALLEHIAGMIRQGFTSGYGPTWSITND